MRTRGSNYDTPLDTTYGNSPTTDISINNLTYHAKQLGKGLLVFGAGLLGYVGFSAFFGRRQEAKTLKEKAAAGNNNLAFPEKASIDMSESSDVLNLLEYHAPAEFVPTLFSVSKTLLSLQKSEYEEGKSEFNHRPAKMKLQANFPQVRRTIQSFTDELIAYYPFNGNANDESGNGNNGTVIGASLTTDRFGIPNSAYIFDGNNDYIDTTDFSLGNKFSIAFWINPYVTDDGQGFIGKHYSTGGNNIFLIGFYVGGYHIAVQNEYINVTGKVTGWQYLTVIVEQITSGTSNVTFYRNATLLRSQVLNDVTGNMSGRAWTIGQDWDPPGSRTDFFRGKIDEVRFYNRALSAEEIYTLFSNSEIARTSTIGVTL